MAAADEDVAGTDLTAEVVAPQAAGNPARAMVATAAAGRMASRCQSDSGSSRAREQDEADPNGA